jgi:hypothetical protein
MNVDFVAAARLVSWPLAPWHFALLCAVIVVALGLDVVAVVLISRRITRAARMRSHALGAVAIALTMRTGVPPASWIQRARPVTAAYRLTLAARGPGPIPVARTPPVRREPPVPVTAPVPAGAPASHPASPSAPVRAPLATRVIRSTQPIRVEQADFARSANALISDAIGECRKSAGGENR